MNLTYGHDRQLRKGVNIDYQDENGNTALMWASKEGFEELAVFLSTYEDMDGRRASLNVQNKNGITALIFASFSGHDTIAKNLVHQGANVDVRDSTNATALIWAAEKGRKEIALMLIERGANLDFADENNGHTALHWSSIYGDSDIAQALIDKGASLNLRSVTGKTPLVYAMRHAHIDIAQALQAAVSMSFNDGAGREL